jgi:peptide/nickel transport system ATP-binding protein
VSLRHRPPHLVFPDATELEEPLLDVQDLRTFFHTARGVVKANNGVSFTLDRGKTLGVVGESGSGKTVLTRSIMGLLPNTHLERSGSVRFAGHELTSLTPQQLRDVWGTQMSVIFQDPMTALNPVVRVDRQLTESLRIRLGLDRRAAHDTAIALLTSVGIPAPAQRMRNYPHELSGGMRQRVMIAIALACGPKLVLADEPTTGLDVTLQAQILDLLATLQRERSMGMILVTHDLGVVANRADDIAVMYAGRIVEQAPTKDLFSHTRMPYTEALLRSIPRLVDPSHTRLRAIPGRPPDLAALPEGCPFAPRCPYAQDRCRTEDPPSRTAGAGHLFRCWFPVGSPQGEEALARNVAAGVPAALAFTGAVPHGAIAVTTGAPTVPPPATAGAESTGGASGSATGGATGDTIGEDS